MRVLESLTLDDIETYESILEKHVGHIIIVSPTKGETQRSVRNKFKRLAEEMGISLRTEDGIHDTVTLHIGKASNNGV